MAELASIISKDQFPKQTCYNNSVVGIDLIKYWLEFMCFVEMQWPYQEISAFHIAVYDDRIAAV